MTKNNDIIFEDPEDEILEHEDDEELDSLLESNQAGEEVIIHVKD